MVSTKKNLSTFFPSKFVELRKLDAENPGNQIGSGKLTCLYET